MHLFDHEQHVLIELAGIVLFLAGVVGLLSVAFPVPLAEVGTPAAVVTLAVGLVLMGYQKVARQVKKVAK